MEKYQKIFSLNCQKENEFVEFGPIRTIEYFSKVFLNKVIKKKKKKRRNAK